MMEAAETFTARLFDIAFEEFEEEVRSALRSSLADNPELTDLPWE